MADQPSGTRSSTSSSAQQPLKIQKMEMTGQNTLAVEFAVQDLMSQLLNRRIAASGHCSGCIGCSGCSHFE